MKKLFLSLMAAAVALSATQAGAQIILSNGGAITFKLTVLQQLAETEGGPTYTTTKTSTNITYTSAGTVRSIPFGNTQLKALLANSFGTTFAATDTLAIDSNRHVYVLDKTKTVVLDASSVISISRSSSVYKGKSTYTITEALTGPKNNQTVTTNISGSYTDSETGYYELTYDDSSVITNGAASTFTLTGIATLVSDGSYKLATAPVSFSLPTAAGTGTIQGTNSVLSGSVTGSAKEYTD